MMVGMFIRRKIGPKGQVVIPKVIREALGIKPGDWIVMEIREEELLIKPDVDPERFIDDFCSVAGRKMAQKIDLERILEEEVEERVALH